jgi:spore coat polysaccharide biosynthesis predicted glycosyltransferase SpsG
VFLVNEDEPTERILNERSLPFRIVDLGDDLSNWETDAIGEYGIDVWLNDRLDTSVDHAKNVRENDVRLVTIDDLGDGAELSNIHFAAMPCIFGSEPKGEAVYTGVEYLILNREIEELKRLRNKQDRILVTLGGSDTHGVTVKVVRALKELSKSADIVIGPSFRHKEGLSDITDDGFTIRSNVPSLISEFHHYDLAITGGGITPFEANASGLPCIIVANEPHEIENARFLDQLGSSVFAGFHDSIERGLFATELDIGIMSETGLNSIKTSAVREIYRVIKDAMQ